MTNIEKFALKSLRFYKYVYRELKDTKETERTSFQNECFQQAKEILTKFKYLDENGKYIKKI